MYQKYISFFQAARQLIMDLEFVQEYPMRSRCESFQPLEHDCQKFSYHSLYHHYKPLWWRAFFSTLPNSHNTKGFGEKRTTAIASKHPCIRKQILNFRFCISHRSSSDAICEKQKKFALSFLKIELFIWKKSLCTFLEVFTKCATAHKNQLLHFVMIFCFCFNCSSKMHLKMNEDKRLAYLTRHQLTFFQFAILLI